MARDVHTKKTFNKSSQLCFLHCVHGNTHKTRIRSVQNTTGISCSCTVYINWVSLLKGKLRVHKQTVSQSLNISPYSIFYTIFFLHNIFLIPHNIFFPFLVRHMIFDEQRKFWCRCDLKLFGSIFNHIPCIWESSRKYNRKLIITMAFIK